MAYIDKILWYDEDDRYIPTKNKQEGFVGWDTETVSVRKQYSKEGDGLVSIELWRGDGEMNQEILLSQQNAMRLADTLKMAVVEFVVDNMMEANEKAIEELRNKMNWLEPVIQEEIKKYKDSRKTSDKRGDKIKVSFKKGEK